MVEKATNSECIAPKPLTTFSFLFLLFRKRKRLNRWHTHPWYKIPQHLPGQRGPVAWALSCKARGGWFGSRSGHMPGSQAWSLGGGTWGAADWCFCLTLMILSLSFSLPPSLYKRRNKIFPKISKVSQHPNEHPRWSSRFPGRGAWCVCKHRCRFNHCTSYTDGEIPNSFLTFLLTFLTYLGGFPVWSHWERKLENACRTIVFSALITPSSWGGSDTIFIYWRGN